jgi:hypothetical protein
MEPALQRSRGATPAGRDLVDRSDLPTSIDSLSVGCLLPPAKCHISDCFLRFLHMKLPSCMKTSNCGCRQKYLLPNLDQGREAAVRTINLASSLRLLLCGGSLQPRRPIARSGFRPNRTPHTYRFFFLYGSNYTRESTVPKQSVDWSFIDPLINLRKGWLTLHARRHGWPESRNVMWQAPRTPT